MNYIYIVNRDDYGIQKVFNSWEKVLAFMKKKRVVRDGEYLKVYYPDPETGLIYANTPTKIAIHKNPKFNGNIPKHLETERFGKLETKGLEIVDTPLPEPRLAYKMSVDDFEEYTVLAIDVDLVE